MSSVVQKMDHKLVVQKMDHTVVQKVDHSVVQKLYLQKKVKKE